MPDPKDTAYEILKRVPAWDHRETHIVRELNSGVSSHSWLVRNNKKLYVLRADRTELEGIKPDRVNEVQVRNFLAITGHADALVYFDAGEGILVAPFIDGREWTVKDLKCKEQLTKLALRLKHLHSLKPDVKHIDLVSNIENYESQLKTVESFNWCKEAVLLLIQMQARSSVLCHGDVLPQNIIENEKLWLIDWEYSGLGDPLFDLATVVQHHELEADLSEHFLLSYFEELDDVTRTDFENYRKVYDYMLALWYSVVLKNDPEDAETQKYLEKVKQRINK